MTIPKHEQVREAYKAFAEFLDRILPDGRAKSTAFTNLQVSSMWANFGVAELAPVESETVKKPPAQGTFASSVGTPASMAKSKE